MKLEHNSVTREEIRRFWVQRKMKEEDHLLAAQKAAARKKARNLTKEDYARFEEYLKIIALDRRSYSKYEGTEISRSNRKVDYDVGAKELRLGIKDWWTKSKYAYLN
ncbi:hypothetical protein ZOSMA_180G00170 [Zostera marina]|uniref:Uncharacterized protein n=1 Tax=Zostera marina TaxID=29655 RepID=A0A0K9PR17_ZOSMR|nr:hypothetical protein ZOSMA_180G00170 [Zostera marina]